MPRKLYYHKTDGGAEYLCTGNISGTNEGDLYTAIVRLDGKPELLTEDERVFQTPQERREQIESVRMFEAFLNQSDRQVLYFERNVEYVSERLKVVMLAIMAMAED